MFDFLKRKNTPPPEPEPALAMTLEAPKIPTEKSSREVTLERIKRSHQNAMTGMLIGSGSLMLTINAVRMFRDVLSSNDVQEMLTNPSPARALVMAMVAIPALSTILSYVSVGVNFRAAEDLQKQL